MVNRTLYVGNIPRSCNETTLLALFAAFGGANVRIIEGRGFAFVDVDPEQMQAAIQATNGTLFEGRALNVSEAKPREEMFNRKSGGDSW